jgi:hypothetical protein
MDRGCSTLGELTALRPRGGQGEDARTVARSLLGTVLEDPSQAGEPHWTGVKVHGWRPQSPPTASQ